jgi:YD repeat-containing protein
MPNKKSTLVYRTDLVNIGIGQGQKETVPYLSSHTEFDESGRVISQSSFSPGGLLAEKVVLAYDSAGRVVHETYYVDEEDPSEEKSYEYDAEGRMIKQLKHYLDGSADVTHYEYNESGRLIEKRTVDDEDAVDSRETFAWDGDRLVTHMLVDADGNQLLREDFKYDEKGNMVEHVKDDDEAGEFFRLVVEYNTDGRKIWEKLYDDRGNLFDTTWFEEDEQGRVVQTVEENSKSKKVKHFNFDERGNSTGYEETNGNGDKMVVVEHHFDSDNNPLSSLVFVNGQGQATSQHYELNYEHFWY